MKKLWLLLIALTLVFSLLSCGDDGDSTDNSGNNGSSDSGNNGSSETKKLDITGVSFDGATYTYDGTEKALAVSGTIPDGVSVTYSNEKGTDADTYNATATLQGEGYNTLTLKATLTINRADIVGLSAESEQAVKENGNAQLPLYTGKAPDGVSVKYYFDGVERNGVSQTGEYSVDIVFSGKNYNTLTLNVNFNIKLDLGTLASSVINSFGSVPDIWAFLPESFAPEFREIDEVPVFDDFTAVSSIPVNGMGKQLNSVYGLLTKAQTALSYVNTVYGSMNIIKTLYSNYLDGSPDDYKSFIGNAGPFTFTILIDETSYEISCQVGTVEVTIYSSLEDESYGATIKINSTTSFKYTITGDSVVVAMDILDYASMLVEFGKDEDGNTVGVVYEYLIVSGVEVTATSALIYVGEDYTVLIGTKGDFIPTSDSRNCEVYDNESGVLVGTEVRENVKDIIYNTYWFPLVSLDGIDTIKKIDEMSGTNADTIYINGSSEKLHTKLVGFDDLAKGASRRFDIEFKTMYFYVYDEETDSYESVSAEVPMLFIQVEWFDNFESEFANANKSSVSSGVSLQVNRGDLDAIDLGYGTLLEIYDSVKDSVTHEDITNYCKQ
ncbi:MAG: hypothetical protein IJ459_05745 [Clostridia bacterium]|nr:hypothetical protein [Clostridia bacterium]